MLSDDPRGSLLGSKSRAWGWSRAVVLTFVVAVIGILIGAVAITMSGVALSHDGSLQSSMQTLSSAFSNYIQGSDASDSSAVKTIIAGLGISVSRTGQTVTVSNSAPQGATDINIITATSPIVVGRTGNSVSVSSSFKPCATNTCAASKRTCTRVECIQLNATANACVETPLTGCTPRSLMPYEVCNTEGQCSVKGESVDYAFPFHRQVGPTGTEIFDMMIRMNNSFYANDETVYITIPDLSWTGNDLVHTLKDFPVVTIRPALLTGDEFAERIISLSLATYLSFNHVERSFQLHNNAERAGPYRDPAAAYVFESIKNLNRDIGRTIINATTDGIINGKPIQLDRVLGLRLVADNFHNLKNWYGDANVLIDITGFSTYYSGSRHKGLIYYHFDAWRQVYLLFEVYNEKCGLLLMFTQREEQGGLPLSAYGESLGSRLRMCSEATAISTEHFRKAAIYEEEAAGVYFIPSYAVDPSTAVVFTELADPEGIARQPDLTPLLWQNKQIYRTPWQEGPNSLYQNYTDQNVFDATGSFNIFRFVGNPDDNDFYYSPLEVLQLTQGSEQEAQRVLGQLAYTHDVKLVPERRRYGQALLTRVDNAANLLNDHYTGSWRTKIRTVARVSRNHVSLRAINFDTPCDPDTTTAPYLRVPYNAASNSLYAANNSCGLSTGDAIARFVEYQAGMNEMDNWNRANLENAVNAREGSTYIYIKKFNLTRGIIPNNQPYADVAEIMSNFKSFQTVVAPYGQPGDIVDSVTDSGSSLVTFFQDLQEWVGDKFVKEEYALFGFANSASAGIGKLNTTGTLMTRQLVNSYADEASGAKSDVECLGRHYGYYADGTPGYPGEPYQPATPNGNYKFYSCMDYIYRQHYAYNTAAPLTPSNVNDPVTGKYKYQFTDAGDGTRRAALIAQWTSIETDRSSRIRAGRPGTYNRWKRDWMLQKIALYVVDTAVSKGLMLQDFSDRYFKSTVIDTNNATTLTYTGPNAPYGGGRRVYRVRGQLSGSANSGSSLDFINVVVNTTISYSSFVPSQVSTSLGTLLHEGALGHGFDTTPTLIGRLRGIEKELAWPARYLSTGGYTDETGFLSYDTPVPAAGSIFEGFATLGEVLGIINGYYVKFDNNGLVIPGSFEPRAALVSMVSLSRIAARQVCSVGLGYSRHSWSFDRLLANFKAFTGFSTAASNDYIDRFHQHPMQQTSYANGFITNVGIISYLTDALAGVGKTFSLARFIQFRIVRVDYIVGAGLAEILNQDIYLFATDSPIVIDSASEDTPDVTTTPLYIAAMKNGGSIHVDGERDPIEDPLANAGPRSKRYLD